MVKKDVRNRSGTVNSPSDLIAKHMVETAYQATHVNMYCHVKEACRSSLPLFALVYRTCDTSESQTESKSLTF